MAVMIGIAFRVSWLCYLLIGGITCSTSDGYPAPDSDAARLYTGPLRSKGYGNYNSPTAQLQAQLTEEQQKHLEAILQNQLAPMPQAPQKMWYPTQMPQQEKQPATVTQQQTLPASYPKQPQAVLYPAKMPQKQPTAEPQWHPAKFIQEQPVPMRQLQKELTAIPPQLWQPAQIPQQHKQPAAKLQLVWQQAPIPQQPHDVWYPSKMVQKQQAAATLRQKELTTMPQEWHPAQFPQQQKQPALMLLPQKELTTMPPQVWHPAQMPQQQKQLATMLQKQPAPMPQPQKQQATMPPQVWHPAQMPQQQKQPATEPHDVWYPAKMVQKQQAAATRQQKELTAVHQQPQQVWYPDKIPRTNQPLNPSSRSNRPPWPSKHGIQLKSPSCRSNRPLNLSSKLNRPPCPSYLSKCGIQINFSRSRSNHSLCIYLRRN
ncbi:adenylate cyclase, terminal-differentiation specific-like [Oncorhynchus keta]|uniref:adenylate cyclase, terminal-differentiation specific-like n=1 Tax=Oncorhynchus keta TaxID=8018 RepID=UPI00227B0771|nr:adenylate cyclase, terminal-differentiation specific-like [Oncorhynchus keta]